MREKRRSEFGERLFQARTHAGLSQPQLAKAVGMAQGTLGEAERTGRGSSYTAQIAQVTGVRAEWLATGTGEMLDGQAWPFKRIDAARLHALSESEMAYIEGRLEALLEDAEQRANPFRNSPNRRTANSAENPTPELISQAQDESPEESRRRFLDDSGLGQEGRNAQRSTVGRASKKPHAGRA